MTRLLGLTVVLTLLASATGLIGSASAQPNWAAPGECLLDDGYNRIRTCSGGSAD